MEGRRRITLYDQMTAGNSSTSLADLILNDNVVLTGQKSDDAVAAVDVAAAAASAGGSCQLSQQSRTLVDILHEDEPHNNDNNNNNNETTSDRKSRKALNFMDKLRLKLTLNSKSNYNSNNNSNSNNDNNYEQGNNSHQQQQQPQNDAVSAEPENASEATSVTEPVVVGVSLMDLLEETDVETGFEVSSYRMSDADSVVVNECEEGEEKEEGASVVERNCCVCMVRHKGAAFIPCGHTFCRACSREVWVSRGNCPLCNNLILEILDIF